MSELNNNNNDNDSLSENSITDDDMPDLIEVSCSEDSSNYESDNSLSETDDLIENNNYNIQHSNIPFMTQNILTNIFLRNNSNISHNRPFQISSNQFLNISNNLNNNYQNIMNNQNIQNYQNIQNNQNEVNNNYNEQNIQNEVNNNYNEQNVQEIENHVNHRIRQVMEYVNMNMFRVDEELLEYINLCYLKNLQYDNEINELIHYTILTIFSDGYEYSIENLATGLLTYSLSGRNIIFIDNYDIIENLLNLELKRFFTRQISYSIYMRLLTNLLPPNYEDVKLTVEEEELEKIPIELYKNLDLEVKKDNTNCIICRDEYKDDDNIRLLSCKHIYHKDCIDNWLKEYSYKCPHCREKVAEYKPNI